MIRRRLRLTRLIFSLAALVLIGQLFNLQIVKNRSYRILADRQHFNERLITAKRGRIFSDDGFPLVVNRVNYRLFAEIPKIKEAARAAKSLAELLLDPAVYSDEEKKKGLGNLKRDFELRIKEKLESKNLVWISLFHGLAENEKKRIEDLKIEGLGFDEEPARYYPEGSLAAHVLGFLGSDENGEPKGYYGLEGYYDGDLKGHSGRVVEERSVSGLPILSGGYREIVPEDGRDLTLTLNRSIQYLVEKRLGDGVEAYRAKSATAIVMDPESGAVVAMASVPSFNPAEWAQEINKNQKDEDHEEPGFIFRNPSISETYEPGSVAKAMTISAAIDSDLITPQTEFDDSGPILVSGNMVDNWDRRHHGQQNIIQLLQKSNNIGAAFVGRKLGTEKLRNYLTRFGFGYPTGIDLAGEDTGSLKKLSDWREIDLVTAAFGQGISATPLQLTTAFTAIANGGSLFRPFLVRELSEKNGRLTIRPVKIRQVIENSKAVTMIDLLTAAAEGGEGKFFVLKKYRVAGKTGTAQIPVAGHYDPNKSNATFIGFLPSSLRFVMLVKIKEPTTSIYAAETAVPLWMTIAKDLVSYYGIPPDR